MLLDAVTRKLEENFAGQFSVSKNEIVFPARHPDVGSIAIVEEDGELRVFIGNFTHIHFTNYDDSLTPDQVAEHLADSVVGFLLRLFSDQVVLWGSRSGRGGCYPRGGKPSILSFRRGQEYVWSGPISDNNRSL